MEEAIETAVFRGDDPDCMVAAGLACRACLSGDVEWALQYEPFDARARCRCLSCSHERTIALTGDQALRLSLHAAPADAAAPPALSGLALVPV